MKKVLNKNKVYIIAEAGVAHFGSLKKAKKLVDLAANSGADAVKFQSYITKDFIYHKFKEWFRKYEEKEVDFSFLKKIKEYCKKKKIEFLCTPHTESTLSWIKKLDVPIIKVGSGELGNFEFLKKIIKQKKHIIISTGMHTRLDMINLKKFFLKQKYSNVSFLRCITSYPTNNKDINLQSFNQFKKIFKNFKIGYSDHTNHDLAILGAVVLGAKIIEKHIALDFNVKNAQDWKVSFNELRFKDMVKKIRQLEKIMGKGLISISREEKKSIKWATKGIYAKKNIKKWSKFSLLNTCAKRPNNGLNVKLHTELLGKKAKSNIIRGYPLKRYQIV